MSDQVTAPAAPTASDGGPDEPERQRWERRTEGPLLVLAALFGVAYAVPVVHPDGPAALRLACRIVDWGVWLAFAGDYAVRLWLSRRRWTFVRRHPFELAMVLLPLLRPLRLLRLVSALLLVGQRARMASQIRLTTYVGGACVGLLMFGSLAVLEAEQDVPGSNIKTLGDAVWWAFVTMTTVGYGDASPVTPMGRLLAVGLMLSGIALLGVVTANIAAWFISRFERQDERDGQQAQALAELTAEVRALRAQVARLSEQAVLPAQPGTGDAAVAPPPAAPPTIDDIPTKTDIKGS